MIDLNHGGAKKGDDPSHPLEDRINRRIDAHFSQKNFASNPKGSRPYVGASGISEECKRKIQLEFIWQKYGNIPDPDPFDGKTCKRFEMGHVFEDMAAAAIIGGGWDLKTGENGKQYGFSELGGDYRGHYDGVVLSGPVLSEYPRLWECKALKGSYANSIMREGLENAAFHYYGQIQVNQLRSGLLAPCWMTIINKDTATWHHVMISHNPRVAERLDQKAREIVRKTNDGELISRPYSDPMNFECRKNCKRWKDVCWKQLPA